MRAPMPGGRAAAGATPMSSLHKLGALARRIRVAADFIKSNRSFETRPNRIESRPSRGWVNFAIKHWKSTKELIQPW
jgi:hypothetical protein